MFNYDTNAKAVASEEKIQSTLVDQVIMSIVKSFKLTCDVASVFSLQFTHSSSGESKPERSGTPFR